jgi:hypothetical protein
VAVIALPQESIRVDVSFYDENEHQRLLQYPTATAIERLTAAPVDVPTAEFLTYYLFHRKKIGTPGYRDYDSIGRKLDVALATLDECIEFDGHSIHTPAVAERQLTEISEHIGEAVGLSVVARIHDLTEADWAPIPQQAGRNASPTFDFQIASDGTQFVQVENKGSAALDNRGLEDSVKAQYRRIVAKKAKLRERAVTGSDPYPASLRYGTITVVDSRKDGNVLCLLTDPPPDPREDTPRRFRLVQRMRFIRDWVSFISPRSQLAAALSTRVAALENMRDPFELNGVHLVRGNGRPFDFAPYRPLGQHSTFLANRSRVTDGPAGGEVVRLSENALFLLGVREDLLVLAASQRMDDVLTYRQPAATIDKTVECVVSRARFESLRLPDSVTGKVEAGGRYLRFELRGQLQYSSFGLVFGILPFPEG